MYLNLWETSTGIYMYEAEGVIQRFESNVINVSRQLVANILQAINCHCIQSYERSTQQINGFKPNVFVSAEEVNSCINMLKASEE